MRDFESMRSELIEELETLEDIDACLACAFGIMVNGKDHHFPKVDRRIDDMSDGEFTHANSIAQTMRRNRCEFYVEALEKLRAHGRAMDWPDRPWEKRRTA